MRSLRRSPARKAGRVATTAVVLVALGLVSAPTALADDIDERLAAAQENARRMEAQRRELEQSLARTTDQLTAAAIELNRVEARLPVAQAELERAEADLARARREAEILAGRLRDAEEQEAAVAQQLADGEGKVDEARAEIAQLAREASRGRGEVSALGIATGAQSTDEFLRTLAVSSSAARAKSRTLATLQDAEAVARGQEARLQAIREVITQLKRAADENVVRAREAERVAQERKAEVQALIAQQRQLAAQLETRRAETMEDLDANEADRKAMAEEIRQLRAEQEERNRRIEEERRRREEEERRRRQEEERRRQEEQRRREEEQRRREEEARQNNRPAPAPAPAAPAPAPPAPAPPAAPSSFLAWPVANPRVTSPFGMRFHPVLGVWRMHNGTDFRAACGVPIFASQSGIVVRAAHWSGAGNNILIDHGRHNGRQVMTRYSHLQSMGVRVGDWVNQGQQIGRSGTTGTSTGCHLHFEVWVNGSVVDPMTWLP